MTATHPLVKWHHDGPRCTICGRPLDPATGATVNPDDDKTHRKCPNIARHIKKLIAAYPRCNVCRKPMVAGQIGTHLSCRPGRTTKGKK